MSAPRDAHEIREANIRYHDVAAESYDSKWGIDFGEVGRGQVCAKLTKALGTRPARPFRRSLEIGSGTGYFSLNLLLAGVIEEAVCSDVSPGMLDTLRGNAQRLGLDVETAVADAVDLPFEDCSFDLVLGHAVLHHLPNLARSFSEFRRVLEPGGTLVFAGEPSRTGDRIAGVPKRGARMLAPLWRRALGAGERRHEHEASCAHDHQLERVVDVHAFMPEDLARISRESGFGQVRVSGEELLANWFGWANRTLEASAEPDQVPWLWRQYAFRGYIALQAIDRRVLEPRLPPTIFYNLMVSATRPA